MQPMKILKNFRTKVKPFYGLALSLLLKKKKSVPSGVAKLSQRASGSGSFLEKEKHGVTTNLF